MNSPDVTIRWVPGTYWVRIALSLTGSCAPKPRGQWLYCGMVRRYAWTYRGRGLVVMWMHNRGPSEAGDAP